VNNVLQKSNEIAFTAKTSLPFNVISGARIVFRPPKYFNGSGAARTMAEDQNKLFREAIARAIADFGIGELTSRQLGLLAAHYDLLRRWNRRTNLTRIIEPREAARFHYAESIFGARFVRDKESVLDIGSGAGFPAVPLAIIKPEATITALEANQKKSLFLNEAKDALGLDNFKVANIRLEEFDRGSFDLLTSRALDRAQELLPEVIAGLSARQRFMLFCSPDLLEAVRRPADQWMTTEIYPIPQSASRLIAIIGQKSGDL
jgi:16S rRNA (guanine527-N7)-methyltransferase